MLFRTVYRKGLYISGGWLMQGAKRNIAGSIFNWFDRISFYSGYVAAGISIILTLIVTLGVVLRYAFNAPLFWIDEISGYMFVAYICLGVVYATLKESHISSEMIISNMPMKVQYAVAIIGYITALLVSCAMVYYGTKTMLVYFSLGWKSETTLGIILWPVWLMIPLGFTIFALAAISRINAITVRLMKTGTIEPPISS
jgi:TRAP-type mannitol/chloroaromatic compound transport system permease small subunit